MMCGRSEKIDAETSREDCGELQGIFQGESTECADVVCDGASGSGGGPAGDVNGDGAVRFDDLVALLWSWGDCLDCPADLDSDGTVGFQDLLILLSNWS